MPSASQSRGKAFLSVSDWKSVATPIWTAAVEVFSKTPTSKLKIHLQQNGSISWALSHTSVGVGIYGDILLPSTNIMYFPPSACATGLSCSCLRNFSITSVFCHCCYHFCSPSFCSCICIVFLFLFLLLWLCCWWLLLISSNGKVTEVHHTVQLKNTNRQPLSTSPQHRANQTLAQRCSVAIS